MTKKQIIAYALLTIITLTPSFAFWYLWQQLLLSPLALFSSLGQNLTSVALLALSAVGMLAGISLVALLIEQRVVRLLSLVLTSAVPLIFLNNNPIAVITALILTLSLAYFSWQAQREVQNHIQFDPWHIFGYRLSLLVTVLSLLMGLQFFAASQSETENFEFRIPDNIFQQAVKIVQPMLEEQIDERVQGTRDQIDRQLAQVPLFEQIPPEYQASLLRGEIPLELQSQLRQQGVSEAEIQSLEQQLRQATQEGQLDPQGLEEQVTQTFLAQFKTELETQINRLIQPYRKYLPVVLGILVFLTVNSLGWLIKSGSIAAIGLLVKLLLASQLLYKQVEDVEAERLQLTS